MMGDMMYKIGVQTKGLLPEKDIDEAFRIIKNAGFDCVDINIDAFLINSDLYQGKVNTFFSEDINLLIDYFMQYRVAMAKYGIVPSQMHAPYPVRVEYRDKQNSYMQGEVIPKCLIIAEVLGVPWVIVHPFKMQYRYSRQKEYEANMEYFKMLVPILKQCRVGICFENLYEGIGRRLVEGVCADPKEAVRYIDTLNDFAGEELFGFCLDTGHLQLVKRPPAEFIHTVGHRLKCLHLHENDGVADIHQMPYTFGDSADAGQDWNSIMAALKDVGFAGTLSFETYPTMNSFPPSVQEAALAAIHDIGEYWSRL